MPKATHTAKISGIKRDFLLVIFLFLEEEIRAGGFGMNLSDALRRLGALEGRRYEILALENGAIAPRRGETPWQSAGLDAPQIQKTIRRLADAE